MNKSDWTSELQLAVAKAALDFLSDGTVPETPVVPQLVGAFVLATSVSEPRRRLGRAMLAELGAEPELFAEGEVPWILDVDVRQLLGDDAAWRALLRGLRALGANEDTVEGWGHFLRVATRIRRLAKRAPA